jgi:hypothetical protein
MIIILAAWEKLISPSNTDLSWFWLPNLYVRLYWRCCDWLRDGRSGVPIQAGARNFPFLQSPLRPALGRTKFYGQWLRVFFFPRRKRPGYEVYSTLPCGGWRMSGAVPPLSIYLFMTWAGTTWPFFVFDMVGVPWSFKDRIQSVAVLFLSGGNLRLNFQIWKGSGTAEDCRDQPRCLGVLMFSRRRTRGLLPSGMWRHTDMEERGVCTCRVEGYCTVVELRVQVLWDVTLCRFWRTNVVAVTPGAA